MNVTSSGAGTKLDLDIEEAGILRGLLGEMLALLTSPDPSDPVMERLFPSAYEDDDDDIEYRSMTSGELDEIKKDAINTARDGLGTSGPASVEISESDLGVWLALLTDLRLAIGARLEVDEQMMEAPLNPKDPRTPALAVLHWLGWIQECLLEGPV